MGMCERLYVHEKTDGSGLLLSISKEVKFRDLRSYISTVNLQYQMGKKKSISEADG